MRPQLSWIGRLPSKRKINLLNLAPDLLVRSSIGQNFQMPLLVALARQTRPLFCP